MLEVHGGLLAWSVVTFILLLIVLKIVAWGPILTALEARESEIRDALDSAKKARVEAEKVSNEYEEMVKKAQHEAQQIVADGKIAGERMKAEIETSAKAKSDEMIAKAKEQIDIQSVVVDISLTAASKIIEKNLDSVDNRKLVDDTIEGIGKA